MKRGPGRPRKEKKAPNQFELTEIIESAITEAFRGTGGLNAAVVRSALLNAQNRLPYMWRSVWMDLK